MTYCVGVLLDKGIILASDSRTNAGVDNFAKFCKMTVFERPGDRVIVLLSSGNLAGTQAVISLLKQRGDEPGGAGTTIWNARIIYLLDIHSPAMAVQKPSADHRSGLDPRSGSLRYQLNVGNQTAVSENVAPSTSI